MSDDWPPGGAAPGGTVRGTATRSAGSAPPPVRPAPGQDPGPDEGWPLALRWFGVGVGDGWRWLRPKYVLVAVMALVSVFVLVGVGMYVDLNAKLSRANVLVAYPGRPTPGAGTNWLITGSDSRGGLTLSQENQLALGHDISGGRSDTIMVLHIPANGTRPVLLSIPRDSYVPIPGNGYNKINAAYAIGGPKLLAETVQNVTGLYIGHYLGIGLGGLVSVVNDVGGVRMCIPAPMHDPLAGLSLKKGCQTLTGEQALAFTRTRAFALGDLQREQDQRLLLASLLSKMTSAGTLINPFASIPAARGAASALTVDSGTQLDQLISVAFALRNPVSTSVPFGGFENTNVGSVVLWDRQQARQMFGDLATDQAVPKSLISGTSVEGTA